MGEQSYMGSEVIPNLTRRQFPILQPSLCNGHGQMLRPVIFSLIHFCCWKREAIQREVPSSNISIFFGEPLLQYQNSNPRREVPVLIAMEAILHEVLRIILGHAILMEE
mmetsp:Transcript_19104/g.43491  ORF Transcript_19104/g.43491 Transcript_19104/m.43491 type:complete len:109 (+) Transcript_19104:749-1075(+)